MFVSTKKIPYVETESPSDSIWKWGAFVVIGSHGGPHDGTSTLIKKVSGDFPGGLVIKAFPMG